jgi:phenylacetate-coenzyme A ligase PaaK-like adenylate-forming protein
MVEARDTTIETQALKTDLERRMKEVLGVRVTVEIHGSGALDSYTGTSKTSKVKRLADRRR